MFRSQLGTGHSPEEWRIATDEEQRGSCANRRAALCVDASGPESWTIDEVTHAGRENLDPAHVERYDQKEDAAATRELAALWAYGLDELSTVVDLGSGTAQFALLAAAVPADLYSRYALHHLPDFWKALALLRMARMLRVGGILRLSDVVYRFEATTRSSPATPA